MFFFILFQDVACNKLTSLPLEIGELGKLRVLNARENLLSELPLSKRCFSKILSSVHPYVCVFFFLSSLEQGTIAHARRVFEQTELSRCRHSSHEQPYRAERGE